MTKTATWLWVQLGGPIEYKAKGILGNQSLFILQLFVTGQQSSICVVLLWRHRDEEQRQRGREWFSEAEHTHTAESTEKRDECWSERECLNFGLNRLESAISAVSPVSTNTSWVGANRAKSQPRRCESAKKKKKPRGRRGPTRHQRAVSGVPRTSPCRAASDTGAAPLEPRPCIPGSNKPKDQTQTRRRRFEV